MNLLMVEAAAGPFPQDQLLQRPGRVNVVQVQQQHRLGSGIPRALGTNQAGTTMDVLVKTAVPRGPPTLRSQALVRMAVILARTVQGNQMECQSRGPKPAVRAKVRGNLNNSARQQHRSYVLNSAEEQSRRLLAKNLSVQLREDVLEATLRVLIMGTQGRQPPRPTMTSGAHLEQPPPDRSLPILIASAFEILFDSGFRKCLMPSVLHFDRQSRLKALHRLHQKLNRTLQEARFDSYVHCRPRLLGGLAFSEEYLLTNCFNKMPNLVVLDLPNICSNSLLLKVAQCCPLLQELGASGSCEVTNEGVAYLTATTIYEPPSVKKSTADRGADDSIWRCTKSGLFHPLDSLFTSGSPKNLKTLDLTGTGISQRGLEAILSAFKHLLTVMVDDDVWQTLFDGLGSEEICFECIGESPSIRDLRSRAGICPRYLPWMVDLLPGLRTLKVDLAAFGDENGAGFESQLESAMRSFRDFDHMCSLAVTSSKRTLPVGFKVVEHLAPMLLESGGQRLTSLTLNFQSGRTGLGNMVVAVNASLLSQLCPNLESLTLSQASVVFDDTGHLGSGIGRPSNGLFGNLKAVQLCQVETAPGWKTIVKCAKQLEKLTVWNMVVGDHDLADIMECHGSLKELKEIRVGCDEIGFIRLSEDSVVKLLRGCPKLVRIGGICEWRTRDLPALLDKMTSDGTWSICLEPFKPD